MSHKRSKPVEQREGEPLCFVVGPDQDGQRLDRLVARQARLSRRQARLLIASALVCVNERPVRILTRPVRAGARVTIQRLAPDAVAPARGDDYPGRGRREPVTVLMLDRWLAVVAKPAGLLSESDDLDAPSVLSAVPKLLAARGERDRVWLVHRLDAGTSGVVVLARTAAAARVLSEAFRRAEVRKHYVALCTGRLADSRLIDVPIARLRGVRHGVAQGGKASQTQLRPMAYGSDATLVHARPRTGRTHQIRVHLAHAGHPILGDRLYGGRGYTTEAPPQPIGRPMLHAYQIVVPHPKTGKQVTCTAPLPSDLLDLGGRLGIAVPAELLPDPERERSRAGAKDPSSDDWSTQQGRFIDESAQRAQGDTRPAGPHRQDG